MKKNRNLVYEKLLGNEEGIDEHSEITKQLKENLHNEESKELVRNKIFKNRKKAYNSTGKNMKFARLSQINEELDKELEKKNNNKIEVKNNQDEIKEEEIKDDNDNNDKEEIKENINNDELKEEKNELMNKINEVEINDKKDENH